jgi:transposase-like protein
VLAKLRAVEQRYRAVLEVPGEGVSVTEVARRYGVARQTVHGRLRRYAEDGLGGLADRPSAASCPNLMPALVEPRIVAMRLALVRLARWPRAGGADGRITGGRGPRATGLVADGRDGPGPPGRWRRGQGRGRDR